MSNNLDPETEKYLDKMLQESRKELKERFPHWEDKVSEMEDQTVDYLEIAYSDFLNKYDLWIEYPIELGKMIYKSKDDITIKINEQIALLGLTNYLLFPLKLDKNDMTIGHICVVSVEGKLFIMFFKNKKLPKSIASKYDIDREFGEFKPEFDDIMVKCISDYVDLMCLVYDTKS